MVESTYNGVTHKVTQERTRSTEHGRRAWTRSTDARIIDAEHRAWTQRMEHVKRSMDAEHKRLEHRRGARSIENAHTPHARTHARTQARTHTRVTPESLTCSRVTHARTHAQTNARVTHESLPSHSLAHELRTHAQMRNAAQRTSHFRVTHLLTSYASMHELRTQARVTHESFTHELGIKALKFMKLIVVYW